MFRVEDSCSRRFACGGGGANALKRWYPYFCRSRRMLAKLNTFALVGIDAVPVEVEVDASAGLPKTILVGLPEAAVRESIHRIERALVNLGYERHVGRTVINLAPADLKT